MTNRITPELLVALDLERGQTPTHATIEYLKTHEAPNLEAEIAKVQHEINGAAAEEAKARARRKSWVYCRKLVFRKYRGDAVKERGLIAKYYFDGATLEELVQITEGTVWYVEKILNQILEGKQTDGND